MSANLIGALLFLGFALLNSAGMWYFVARKAPESQRRAFGVSFLLALFVMPAAGWFLLGPVLQRNF